MYSAPINNSLSFKRLDFTNVSTVDRENFIRKNFKQLKELGQYYDIKLTSTYADVPEFAAIDIDVKPLKSNLNFFERLFCPIGRSTFITDYECAKSAKPSIVNSVRDAIVDLGKKMCK